MALTRCRECGAEISTEANRCPKCGHKGIFSGCGGCFLVFIICFGALIGGCALLAIVGALTAPLQKHPAPSANANAERQASSTNSWAGGSIHDDWGKGYDLGYKTGRLFATSGEPVPTAEGLRAAASQISSHSTSIVDKEQFDKGYYSGFAQGYKDASKPAF